MTGIHHCWYQIVRSMNVLNSFSLYLLSFQKGFVSVLVCQYVIIDLAVQIRISASPPAYWLEKEIYIWYVLFRICV